MLRPKNLVYHRVISAENVKSYQQVCYKSHLGKRIKLEYSVGNVYVYLLYDHVYPRRLKWEIKNSLDNLGKSNNNKICYSFMEKNNDSSNIWIIWMQIVWTPHSHLYLQVILSLCLQRIARLSTIFYLFWHSSIL